MIEFFNPFHYLGILSGLSLMSIAVYFFHARRVYRVKLKSIDSNSYHKEGIILPKPIYESLPIVYMCCGILTINHFSDPLIEFGIALGLILVGLALYVYKLRN